ncbi:carboxypeptidase regulatory-like domain-containing protein [Sinosporangium siamense]|uniref:alpha-amylase n=1 Tax=Sinosporangium siamense TaxID=1367973 RepID=A0A919RDX3_9ACTN|nr:carboxypeptidase regulatory-like domain-containing protein [Sinosporangium siamense]GII91927.1 hypothetical protein Ssi02_21580 [Sinosporangium siamense]
MPRTPLRWRALLTGTAAVLILLLALTLPAGVAQAAPDPGKIDKTLAEALAKAPATFLVRLSGDAALASVSKATTKAAKGAEVLKAKSAHATTSQAPLRELLTAKKAEFTPYWIVNAVKVTGDAALAAEIAKLPGVESIQPDRALPNPMRAAQSTEVPKVNAVEWNIDRVGAPRVWSEFGTRGDGVVVANLGVGGVQYDHPALVTKYRGRKADGTFDHNHNWFDPTRACATAAPCDTFYAAGTRSMGVAVGGTAADAIGVAPGAKWIAVHPGTYTSHLLAAAQWLLAPTDLDGRNPRPDLAPDVVNNTWSDWGIDSWSSPLIDAWIAAGIFPAFTSSTYTPHYCKTVHSPAAGANAYTVGLIDQADKAWANSSRGSGQNDEVKPNLTAPGLNVRTSTADGGYEVSGGDFAAVPHVSGAVALLWSAAPALKGDVAATRALLDGSAVDVPDITCGGTPAKNNVYGEGRLDVHAAVRAAPIGRIGLLSGKVTSGGTPVGTAVVTLTGPVKRTIATGADGVYTLPRLPVGDYRITVRKYGYGDATAAVTVTENQPATGDAVLTPVPLHAVSGAVTVGGAPMAGVVVTSPGTPVEATTDAAGRYRVELPAGTRTLKAVPPPAICTGPTSVAATVAGDTVKDIAMLRRTDKFGYACTSGTAPFVQGTDRLPGEWWNRAPVTASLPFAFPFYGGTYRKIWVTNEGYVSFGEFDQIHQRGIPSVAVPNAVLFPFTGASGNTSDAGVYTATYGTAPGRTHVIEWRDHYVNRDLTNRIGFAMLLGEDGSIKFQYRGRGIAGHRALIGLENEAGTDAFDFSEGQRNVVADGQELTFAPTRHGLLTGTVTDAGGRPLAGAKVKAGDAVLTTEADGTFLGHAPVGDHRVTVEKEPYGSVTRTATVSAGAWTRLNAALSADDLVASATEVELPAAAGTTKSRKVKLTNRGTTTAVYTVATDPSGGWLSATPAGGELAPGASATVTVTGAAAGLSPGAVRSGELLVRSGGGGAPLEIPVTLAVPRHQVSVDSGGTRETTDSEGERWSADRAYTAGGHGYLGARSRAVSTAGTVQGTGDPALFKTAREAMAEYRFDNLPAGVYTVELGFAETRGAQPGARVFDVLAEGRLAVPVLDIAQEAGQNTATTRRYTVKVVDGQLNLRFAAQKGAPLVNTLRVTERPDKTAP